MPYVDVHEAIDAARYISPVYSVCPQPTVATTRTTSNIERLATLTNPIRTMNLNPKRDRFAVIGWGSPTLETTAEGQPFQVDPSPR